MAELDDALRFAGLVLAHAAWIASDCAEEELICPFAIITHGEEREVVAFEAATQAEAIERGHASLNELRNAVDRWGFGREGWLMLAGQAKSDVLTASAWVPRLDEPIHVQQRFRTKSAGGFLLLGLPNVVIHGLTPAEPVQVHFRATLQRGILDHPQGGRWETWRTPSGPTFKPTAPA